MQPINHYPIPTGAAREALREKGQFWTPDWVAQAMVTYALAGGATQLFDPAVGAGAFFRTAKAIAGTPIALAGMDIDETALAQALQAGLSTHDLSNVRVGDFIFDPPQHKLTAIVANPPYIRHHRLTTDLKARLKRLGAEITGQTFDGRAGLHLYFLLRALQLLDTDGRLAVILPADTCEGIFARTLWAWIARNFCLEAVITFDSAASPFPSVDTNPLVFLIRRAAPQAQFHWVRCHQAETTHLQSWIASGFSAADSGAFSVMVRQLSEGIVTGLSRPPVETPHLGPVLGDFARVLRGVATGANDFFFLTEEEVQTLQLPFDVLLPAIGRTRDAPESEITQATLQRLKEKGRPTWLLSLDGQPLTSYPTAVRHYVERGAALGLPAKPLISQRRPWYKMETRSVPPLLFAYLGRRNTRFICNRAGVIPLTGFLCVYPRQPQPVFLERLWKVLNHPLTLANLPLIGKSYGSGAVKVEPRALERLPLPESLVAELGLPYERRLF